MIYDVRNPPAPEEWLVMDEGERVAAVEDAHRRTRAAVGQSAAAHASMHVVIENRLAAGDQAVIGAYERLRAAGVDRHNTIHALASVASQHMLAILAERTGFDQTTADADYAALDPARWRPKPKR